MIKTVINIDYVRGFSFTFHVRISCSMGVFPSKLHILYIVIFKRV